MHKLKEMAMREIKDLEEQNSLNAQTVSFAKSLTSIVKNIDTIHAMDESKYSNRGSYDGSYDGGSYEGSYAVDRRGRNGDGSYRMRADGGRDQRYSYGYSRDLKEDLEHLAKKAEGREKEMLHNWINQL